MPFLYLQKFRSGSGIYGLIPFNHILMVEIISYENVSVLWEYIRSKNSRNCLTVKSCLCNNDGFLAWIQKRLAATSPFCISFQIQLFLAFWICLYSRIIMQTFIFARGGKYILFVFSPWYSGYVFVSEYGSLL